MSVLPKAIQRRSEVFKQVTITASFQPSVVLSHYYQQQDGQVSMSFPNEPKTSVEDPCHQAEKNMRGIKSKSKLNNSTNRGNKEDTAYKKNGEMTIFRDCENCKICQRHINFLSASSHPTGDCDYQQLPTGKKDAAASLCCACTRENHTHGPLNKENQAISQDSFCAHTNHDYDNCQSIICCDASQCDKKLDRGGSGAYNSSKIRLTTSSSPQSKSQSSSESKRNNEDCLSEHSYFCITVNDSGHDGTGTDSGKNRLVESRILATPTALLNAASGPTQASQFTNNKTASGERERGQNVSPKRYRNVYTATATSTVAARKSSFCLENRTRNNKNHKRIIIGMPVGSTSSLKLRLPLLFNFTLFSTFLLSTFNYCNVVEAEILSNSRNHLSQQHNYVGDMSFNSTATYATDSLPPLQPYHYQRSINSSTFETNIYSIPESDGSPRETFEDEPAPTPQFGSTEEENLHDLLSQPLDTLDKNALIKALWDAMTPDEIHRIFGHHPSQKSASIANTVPNFDITLPKLSPHPIRKRRSTHPSSNGGYSSSDKQIELNGLGRQFSLNIYPNQQLLDPYFVHLHRHQNRSEILPQEIVQRQLGCFYHGNAIHVGKYENDVQSGAVAVDLCGGLKGFILPPSTSQNDGAAGHEHHYVIHPLPDRLLKSVPARESSDREGNEKYNRHHIIYRRQGSLFPGVSPQKSSFEFPIKTKYSGDDSSKQGFDEDDTFNRFPACMHHDTPSTHTAKFMKDAYKSQNDNYYSPEDHVSNNELGGKASKLNQEYRIKPIISLGLVGDSGSSINDLESLTVKDKMRLVSSPQLLPSPRFATNGISENGDASTVDTVTNTGTGRNFRSRRRKRSSFDTETIDPFTYKPINTPPDSYWIQFRERGTHGGNGLLRNSGVTSDSSILGYNGNRRLSSQFSYDDMTGPAGSTRFSASSGPSNSFQPSFWHHQSHQSRNPHHSHNLASRASRGSRYDEIPVTGSDFNDDTGAAGSDQMTWSKGILVFEASDSNEDRHYPGNSVPFYTKNNGNKRKAKTTSSVVASTSSTSSSGGNSNTRQYDWFGGGVADTVSSGSGTSTGGRPWPSRDKNRTASKSYSLSDSSSSSTRKGRRDDGVFGDKWKSSLDSEILWADRSNEINKKSKFEDLSNVKDRPPSHLTIETAVFVDKDLYKHMQQNFPDDTQGEVTRIVLAMINAVQLLYQDPSLGHRVDFVLKRLEVLESDPPTLVRPYDIDRFLTNFCKWQKTENPADDDDPLHWDHALILTGLDLYVAHPSGKISNQVVGLAPVAGMCTRSSSCTVNEGRHFESVFVVAHEIGHNLGMRHDGPQAENNCDPTSHIMSPTLGSGKITWSPCSKKYLDLFLDTAQAKCLFDKAKPERWLDHNGDGRLPGERFDADRQCVLKYGRGSFHATQQPLEDVCRDLHCRREFFTWTSHPALDGTRCSAQDDMWCRSGKCVPKKTGLGSSYDLSSTGSDGFSGGSNHLPGSETAAYATQKALDGGWGNWSPFTDCSSACIYSEDGSLTMGSNGVRLAARRCDSPRPENSGRQCSGPDRRYKTCSAQKICTKNPTRTTVSQYAAEVCSRAAQVDTELTGRGYMSSSNNPERACSVWCDTNDNSGPRSRGWSFPDGTACNIISLPKNAQMFCVAGKCQEFTCNSYSHFLLSEDDCAFTSTNDVIPSTKKSSNSNSNGESWLGAGGSNGGVKINHRSGKGGWSDWDVQSECKVACLAPAKGLQLVKRQCTSDDALCTGLSLSVRLCKPDKFSVQSNGCSRLQTPFEYATKVCSKYSAKVTGLSGIGMQLSPTKDDTDRPCRIGCQDSSIAYRFYMVNGEEGWFPAGTDCSRGDQGKKAYCMAGKCVDFGEDDTPLYQVNSNMVGSLFQQPRSKRQATYNIMEPLKTDPGMDESRLKELVQKFSQETGNYPSIVQKSQPNQRSFSTKNNGETLDFSRPVVVPSPNSGHNSINNVESDKKNVRYSYAFPSETKDIFRTSIDSRSQNGRGRSFNMEMSDVHTNEWAPNNPSFSQRSGNMPEVNSGSLRSQPVEGSFYEWRKIVSDCSVACGSGIQEVIVQCVSGDTVVNDSLCQGRPRPGFSGYINCQKRDCARSSSPQSSNGDGKRSHLWNWIQSILPPKNTSYTDTGRTY